MNKKKKTKTVFDKESDLCAAFIASLPDGWTAYSETAGFDILLVRRVDGAQIGVEAKLTLNPKVLVQSVDSLYRSFGLEDGPDFRAALVPAGTASAELKCIASYLRVTVIECRAPADLDAAIAAKVEEYRRYGDSLEMERLGREEVFRNWKPFTPSLPVPGDDYYDNHGWVDLCPAERCAVPAYVPDVAAGASGPVKLTEWKVKAIKLAVILSKRGVVTIADFKFLSMNRNVWLDFRWLIPRVVDGVTVRGQYVEGTHFPDFRLAHPTNFDQIEADFEKWGPPETNAVAECQGALL